HSAPRAAADRRRTSRTDRAQSDVEACGQTLSEAANVRSRRGIASPDPPRHGTTSAMRTLITLVFLFVLFSSIPVRATVPDDLCPAGQDPCIVNTTITVTPGSVIDLAGRALQLGAAARVTVGAGQVQILAGPVPPLAGARITGATGVAPSTFEIDSTGSITLQGSGSTRSR